MKIIFFGGGGSGLGCRIGGVRVDVNKELKGVRSGWGVGGWLVARLGEVDDVGVRMDVG